MRKKREGIVSRNWNKTPLGVKALIIYQAVLGLLYLLFGFIDTKNFLFGFILEGTEAKIFNFIILAVIIAVSYGFLLKQFFAYPLAIIWYSFEILNALVSLVYTADVSTFRFMLVSLAESLPADTGPAIPNTAFMGSIPYFSLEISISLFIAGTMDFSSDVLKCSENISSGVSSFRPATARSIDVPPTSPPITKYA